MAFRREIADVGSFYDRTYDAAYRTALGIVREPALAADVTQEAYVGPYWQGSAFRGEAPSAAWLHRSFAVTGTVRYPTNALWRTERSGAKSCAGASRSIRRVVRRQPRGALDPAQLRPLRTPGPGRAAGQGGPGPGVAPGSVMPLVRSAGRQLHACRTRLPGSLSYPEDFQPGFLATPCR